jgi:hypothetical protein
MASNPAFDLFEEICAELSSKQESVLIDDDFSPETLDEVKRWFHETATFPAVSKALSYLHKHFQARESVLPFIYDQNTGHVTALHRDYLTFVSDAQDQRSLRAEARDFEVATGRHIAKKLTGVVRRVGSPRSKHKTRAKMAAYLVKEFGFEPDVLVGSDQDGGLDILWFPPLGAFPFRAIVSIQCKNSPYDRDAGYQSIGRAKQTLSRHSHSSADEGHLHCVIYNDYIDEKKMAHARDAQFIPLGISDLAPLITPISFRYL